MGAGVERASPGVRKLGSFSTNLPHQLRACSLETLTPPYFRRPLGQREASVRDVEKLWASQGLSIQTTGGPGKGEGGRAGTGGICYIRVSHLCDGDKPVSSGCFEDLDMCFPGVLKMR